MTEYESKFIEFQQRDRQMAKHLRTLQAMLQSPKMCDLYFKADQKRMSKERLKEKNDNAILHLRRERLLD